MLNLSEWVIYQKILKASIFNSLQASRCCITISYILDFFNFTSGNQDKKLQKIRYGKHLFEYKYQKNDFSNNSYRVQKLSFRQNLIERSVISGNFYPNETGFSCGECPYADQCKKWGYSPSTNRLNHSGTSVE